MKLAEALGLNGTPSYVIGNDVVIGAVGLRRSARRSRPRASNAMAKTIYVLNGPNLNSLGVREPEKYGRSTLKDVEKLCRKTAARYGLEVEFRQTEPRGRAGRMVSRGEGEENRRRRD